MASRTISTGVEQGEEKIPPKMPARNAPTTPRFLLFDSRLTDRMRLSIVLDVQVGGTFLRRIAEIHYQPEARRAAAALLDQQKGTE